MNKSKLPRISVITVVRDGFAGIEKTIKSVIEQDWQELEYIIIDGLSVDGTVEVVKRYKDWVDVFISEKDDGIYDAMNKAVNYSSGEYLVFMNCGDIFISDASISSVAKYINREVEQVIFSGWVRQDEGRIVRRCNPDLSKGLFNHQAILYSKSVHAWAGRYVQVNGLTTADYLFFATLVRSGKVACQVLDVSTALIDINGVSAGSQTLAQKYAVDYLFGSISKYKLIYIFIFHGVYRFIRKFLRLKS